MKKLYFLVVAIFMATLSFGQTDVFINEIHYDNVGGDIGEGIEIAGVAGTDLSLYRISLYNGNGGATYGSSINLAGVLPDEGNGYGAIWFNEVGIQNGAPDGMALIRISDLFVLEFLSYEGVITATNGAANGLTSTDIGVQEEDNSISGNTPIGYSLQLTNTGWVGSVLKSEGLLNNNQTLSIVKNQIKGFVMYPNPVANGKLFMTSSLNLNKKVEIYSLTGQQVFSKNLKTQQYLNISKLTKGIYFVKVEENGKIATRKLVVD